MNNQDNSDWIDEYLLGELNPEDRVAFEQKIEQDPTLKADLHLTKKTMFALESYDRNELIEKFKQVDAEILAKKNSLQKKLKHPAIAVSMIVFLFFLHILFFKDTKVKENLNANNLPSVSDSLEMLHQNQTKDTLRSSVRPSKRAGRVSSLPDTANIWGDHTIFHDGGVYFATFSPDGKHLLTGGVDRKAVLWDLATGEKIFSHIDSAAVRSGSFSPDGRRFVINTQGGNGKVFDISSHQLLFMFGSYSDVAYGGAFSPDDRYILTTGASDSIAKLWNAHNGQFIRKISGHINAVRYVNFSPDGKLCLTVSYDNSIIVRNTVDWKRKIKLLPLISRGSDEKVLTAAFSPDNTYVVSGWDNGFVRIWNMSTRSLTYEFKAHNDGIPSVEYSPTGSSFATGSYDSTACLWSLNGNKLASLRSFKNAVASVSFSPDGKRLAIGSYDGTVKIWDLVGEGNKTINR